MLEDGEDEMNWEDELAKKYGLGFGDWGELIKDITSLLKEQRANVADEWASWGADMIDDNPNDLYNLLINAPEPRG